MQEKNIKSLINFSERFAFLINQSGMTQREVAEAIGITQSAVNHYKTGRSEPKSLELYKISKLFGKPIEWLLMGDEVKTDETAIQMWRDRAIIAEEKIKMLKSGMEGLLKKI